MPKILEDAITKIEKKGVPKNKAYAFATSALQRSGALKKGTNKATPKGVKRGLMTPKQRSITRKGNK